MKKIHIYIFTLLLSAVALANGGNNKGGDKKERAPKTRTFAVEPATSAIKMTTTTPTVGANKATPTSMVLQSRTFKSLDAKMGTSLMTQVSKAGEFTEAYINNNFPVDDEANENLAMAIATFNELNKTGNYVDEISSDNLIEFPVGLKKTINNVTYSVGILKATLKPTYTELTIFVRVILPELDEQGNQKQLFFGADGVRLSTSGGFDGEWNLVLLGDFVFGINGGNGLVALKGGLNMESGAIANKSYATIDCNGFRELHLEAEVQFSRNMLEPLKEDYTVDNSKPYPAPNQDRLKRVTGAFEVTVADWNDILVEVSLPRFQMTSFKGLAFEVDTAVFDFSDTRKSQDMTFPPGYEQYLVDGNQEAWRGVFLKRINVVLPPEFEKKNTTDRVKFTATNLLIDGMGVSGDFNVQNILPIDQGKADKWQFSVDGFEATIMANSVTAAGFSGKIVLPVSKEVTANEVEQGANLDNRVLSYTGSFNPVEQQYTLRVTPISDINFDLWNAKTTLAENSYVELAVIDGKFRPKALLHGKMHITDEVELADGKPVVDFPEVTFDNLQLQTVIPYLTVNSLGYSGKVEMAGFPVTLSDINLTASPTNATLSFDIAVNLMENNISGETGLKIKGDFAENEGIQKWQFRQLEIDEIAVEANLGGVAFAGSIEIMEDDPTYGDGFRGSVQASFKGLEGITVSTTVLFGKTDFRYWYVDGLVSNLNIQTGTPFKITGFGGGAYYKMRRDTFGTANNLSGMSYEPDAETGLGVKASLLYANASSARVFNGSLGFDIAFNSSAGGINRISYFGEGHVMQDVDISDPLDKLKEDLLTIANEELQFDNAELEELKQNALIEVAKQVYPANVEGKAGMHAYAAMEFDFNANTIHGEYDLYIDVLGGLFEGIGENKRAGYAVLHFGSSLSEPWYIYMGTPTDPMGIKFGVGPLSIESDGYFMVGHDIPDAAQVPATVARLLGEDADRLNHMRDENALSQGRGFAFGTNFSMDTGNMRFLAFFARFEAGIGFDIMVRDYGEAACSGSGQVGINGWYTSGQAYAYLQGKLGIRVKLLFKKKNVTILSGSAAVLLQTKFPNPSWFKGYLKGEFRVLGGLVRGRFKLKIELGEQCDFINEAPLDGLKIIADVNPADNAANVDVFTVPQVGFNMKIFDPTRMNDPTKSIFEFEDDEGIAKYRIDLADFQFTNAGSPVAGEVTWNETRDLLSFTPTEVLPAETSLELSVSVRFKKWQNENWIDVMQDGQLAMESETKTFTTGLAPTSIPLRNITYSYPVIDQQYFYKNEYDKAYVKLNQGQAYLFDSLDGYTFRALFETDISSEESSVSYDVADKMVIIPLPANISNSTAYRLRIESVPPEDLESQTSELTESYVEQDFGDENEVAVRNSSITGTATNVEVIEILEYEFDTSEYNTFEEKIAAKQVTSHILELIAPDVDALQAEVVDSEPFELVELIGGRFTDHKALVAIEASISNPYYQDEVHPLIYQGYPLENRFTVNRDPAILGIPPTRAVQLLTTYVSYLENDPEADLLRKHFPYRYHLPFYFKQDYFEIRSKIVNAYSSDPELYADQIALYDYIINGTFPYFKPGDYQTNVSYKLPGGIPGSSKVFTFNKVNHFEN
ncbi:hypothetical protein [Aquimarina brevivitae]|uniref:Uncharacterized protein n=1 Tax=Aquimarina brevivitae TaxID=323412 RepID=A0A4Q7P1W2_9FLAO|nr:hypothetical protein [Aquimarina brevivitae]RZS93567.1 hypothetical protein EV197_2147 [Aquimarina brevivitae]